MEPSLFDVFKISSSFPDIEIDLTIFNRWGQVVFKTHQVNDSWDGTFRGGEAPEGVYTWVITYEVKEKTSHVNKKLKKGILTLYR